MCRWTVSPSDNRIPFVKTCREMNCKSLGIVSSDTISLYRSELSLAREDTLKARFVIKLHEQYDIGMRGDVHFVQ